LALASTNAAGPGRFAPVTNCASSEVIDVRPSKSRPEQGLIKLRTTTLNQNDEAVLMHVVNLVVPRRKNVVD
jgi:acyl dehydratase